MLNINGLLGVKILLNGVEYLVIESLRIIDASIHKFDGGLEF